ncbi:MULTISPECIES: heavy-metal-associated domain-containing protein [Myroides]|uniref:heavy-metal-associated domain-containing protein n=1 Tax=Myroides TaxID=76831 RepID=UPI00130346CF|nr:heavy-metal-associated domain-containing protein [Myroides phaeus]
MKVTKSVLVAILGATALVSCKSETKVQEGEIVEQTATATDSKEIAGKVENATFQIEGMTCEIGCAKLIEGKLAGLEGVKEAKVDFDSKTAVVEFDDAKQNSESLTKTVEKIANGIYKVENMQVAENK